MDEKLVKKVAEKLYYMVYPGGSYDEVEEDVRVHWRFKANKVIPLIAEDESKAIIRCIKEAKRVHPDWGIDHIVYLLEFREGEARRVLKKQKTSGKDMG